MRVVVTLSRRLRSGVAISLLGISALACAGPGDLDMSFGNMGFVRYQFSAAELGEPGTTTDARSSSIIQQADGKLVVGLAHGVAGFWDYGFSYLFASQLRDFEVLRFNADGSPDLSFAGGGHAGRDFPGIAATTNAVMQQADGRIVVAGAGMMTDGTQAYRAALARYNTDGSPDTSFGTGGAEFLDVASVTEITAIVQQADGRLIVAAQADNDQSCGALARLNTDGSLDPSFGTGGVFATGSDGCLQGKRLNGLALQADGKLMVALIVSSYVNRVLRGSDLVVMRAGSRLCFQQVPAFSVAASSRCSRMAGSWLQGLWPTAA